MKTLHRFLPPLTLLLLAGCDLLPQPQADTRRHFTLSGPPAAPALADGLAVRPVQLAGHLHNRAMAVRVAENEIIYIEDALWAEPLDQAITQLLRARLGSVGGGGAVTVQVQRFELVRPESNTVRLAASYTIDRPGAPVRQATFNASPRAWTGSDYGTLVGLLREAVGELGDAIAATASAPAGTDAVEKK